MTIKLFIPMFFLGSFLVFSIFPFFNYYIDQWRVLHNDYSHHYKGIAPNKVYLKVSYLLNEIDNYDTLLMGSSRTENIDVTKISSKAYNLSYTFGVVGTHLKNLKTLIRNKTTIKNIWIGINDFEIWKDPEDFERDYLRKPYGNTLEVYKYYLLKKRSKRDIDILLGKYKLTKFDRIINANNIKSRREREEAIRKDTKWVQYLQNEKPTLLKYSPIKLYRIKKTIKEIEEIKKICIEHNISLTLFMNPQIYITYTAYNQLKIEEFKRALSKITNFHDFYRLDTIALNEKKWFDTSHYVPSVGDYIIENIKKNKYLITEDNIEQSILETRKLEHNFYMNNKYRTQ